jgi:outer membrane protein assembly factor BamD
MSVEEKKVERFEQVINECYEFVDRFPDSQLRKETEDFLTRSKENIKNLTNE